MLSEILSALFGRHKEFLLDDLRRRTLAMKEILR